MIKSASGHCIAVLLLVVLRQTTLYAQAQELPTPFQVMERYMQVSGDFSRMANTRILVSSDPFNGVVMDVEIIKDSTNRMRQTVVVYDSARSKKLSETITIYNRGKAVKIEDGKKEPVTDIKLLDEMQLYSYMFSEVAYNKENFKLEMEGIETIKNSDYYRIKSTSPNGIVRTNYYDKETGFLVYIDNEEVKSHLMDYQKINGLMYPMATYTEGANGAVYTLRIKAIYSNEKLKPGLFTL